MFWRNSHANGKGGRRDVLSVELQERPARKLCNLYGALQDYVRRVRSSVIALIPLTQGIRLRSS